MQESLTCRVGSRCRCKSFLRLSEYVMASSECLNSCRLCYVCIIPCPRNLGRCGCYMVRRQRSAPGRSRIVFIQRSGSIVTDHNTSRIFYPPASYALPTASSIARFTLPWKAHQAVFPAPPALEGASRCAFQGRVQKRHRYQRSFLAAGSLICVPPLAGQDQPGADDSEHRAEPGASSRRAAQA